MRKRPSLVRILTTDYLATVTALFPIVLAGFLLASPFIDPESNALREVNVLAVSAALAIVSVGVLAWRVQTINGIFDDGQEANATISRVFFFRDRGRISYEYTYQGEKRASGNAVTRVKRTRGLQVGQEVVVLVDRNNPKRAFLRDLYLS